MVSPPQAVTFWVSYSESWGLRVYIRATCCFLLPGRGKFWKLQNSVSLCRTWHFEGDFSKLFPFFASLRIGKSHRTQNQEVFLLSPGHLCPPWSLQKSRVMNRLAAWCVCAHSFFDYSMIAASTQSGAKKSKEILEPSPGPESDTTVPPWVLAEPWRPVTQQG